MQWLRRFRIRQLEKAIKWMERREKLAELTGRPEDARTHRLNIIETRGRIRALTGSVKE